ncbi:endonuclease/exonuclease/phosphatase family protein [Streptomyces sp. NPDC005017]|uniref:endonuclease/exonuclease/phosphatase family protein n=1 Tax=Streptomyces sp. NPDC005017 TaxID=3364706 RepID=UPI0036B61EE1
MPGQRLGGRERLLVAVASLTAGLLAFHRAVPDAAVRAGSLLEAFLPWLGAVAVVLFVLALTLRSPAALVAVLLPAGVWTHQFGHLLLPDPGPGRDDLVVVQHNVADDNADPAGTARVLAEAGPDLVALQELVPRSLPVYASTFAPDYPYHAVRGTVGLWSRHPLSGTRAVDIRPPGIAESWNRGLRTVVHTPSGPIATYVAHLPSVRLGSHGLTSSRRDAGAELLGRVIAAEPQRSVLLLGDLNGTVDDRGLAPLTSRLGTARRGFAFSFPAAAPVTRIDQVMARPATVGHIGTLPRTGSDHLPVIARITPR